MISHVPVLPREVVELLRPPVGGTVIDGTLGLAGHGHLIALQLGPQGHLIGIDRDSSALAEAKKRLADCSLRIDLLQGNFKDMDQLAAQVRVEAVDGILIDLGISSFQLDDPKRGFSFREEGPLDMRMDVSSGASAADLVNQLPEAELARVISSYGEERFARRIASAIVERRARRTLQTTAELAETILKALPRGYQRGKIHPATRTFQALRIAVNGELDDLDKALESALQLLKPGGRLAVISFHSLEDRIVKNQFRRFAQQGRAEIMTKKPLRPGLEECRANPRSRSARLRALQRSL